MLNRFIAAVLPWFPKKFIWIFSRPYIAGETMEDALRASRDLNKKGVRVTIDILGEFITSLSQAEENKQEYLKLIDAFMQSDIDGNFSLKPTFFGLLIDKEICYKHVREIVAKAASRNSFVRLDMEDSPCTDLEIELYRRLKAEFPSSVGLVLQAYLRRTWSDLEGMLDMNSPEKPLNYRLCKGIYVEPEKIAFKKYEEINMNYLRNLEFMFSNHIYVGIATHDKNLIEGAYELINKYNVPKNMYEFQMLYGVTPGLRQSIVDAEIGRAHV